MIDTNDRELLALRQREAAADAKAERHAKAATKGDTRHSIAYHSAKAQQALKVARRRGRAAAVRERG